MSFTDPTGIMFGIYLLAMLFLFILATEALTIRTTAWWAAAALAALSPRCRPAPPTSAAGCSWAWRLLHQLI